MTQFQVIQGDSYKVGLNEIQGLEAIMREIITPVETELKDRVYWNDCQFEQAEYKSRDGFIAHTHNCGGLELWITVPKCEEYNFPFLEFGECDDAECECCQDGECSYEIDGHLDAALRIFFKFEGIDQETGEMEFYLCASGGNGDAPYFRTKYQADLFETEFTCKSVEGLKRQGNAAVKKLLKLIRSSK